MGRCLESREAFEATAHEVFVKFWRKNDTNGLETCVQCLPKPRLVNVFMETVGLPRVGNPLRVLGTG